jgi:hypothetical protein
MKLSIDPYTAEVQAHEDEQQRVRALRRQELQENPFNPRTEVSADANKIVKHLWIIFVLLPLVLWILYSILHIGAPR